MAEVVRLHSPRPGEIDDYIEYLLRGWEDVPAIAAEWNDLEELDRLDFVLEWPIKTDRLNMLNEWARAGAMTPAQCVRFEGLLGVVAQHRATLEALLAE